LRSIPREVLDDAMTASECLIVSHERAEAFDAYVLRCVLYTGPHPTAFAW
jgi:hypothetical protein